MTVRDLRREPPRRWTETVDGIRWLPRLIDKARSMQAGTLGGYLYGQSPMDHEMLRTAGCSHRRFAAIVRAEPTDEGVLRSLEAHRPGARAALQRWSETMGARHRAFLFVLDLDDGYAGGGWRWIKAPANAASNALTWAVKRVWPSNAANGSQS